MRIATTLAAVLLCGSAQAATLRFDAYSPSSTYSDFSILFDDVNNDSLMAFSEIVSFSGFTCSFFNCYSGVYDTVSDIPLIAGFTSDTGPNPYQTWQFNVGGDPNTNTYPLYAANFTYSISQVPVPGSGLLLIGGIGLLAARSRRRSRGTRSQPSR